MELTGIAAGLLVAIGVLVAGAGAVLHHWAAGHQDLLRAAGSRLGQLLGGPHRAAGQEGRPPGSGREFAQGVLALLLITGLAVVMLAAVGLGKLVDDVTDSDGVAVVDHPVAQFVATHRVPALTAFMAAVSTVGGPAGMVVLAVVAGVLFSVAWRSWAPVVIVAVTAAGVIGLTVVFKAALGLPRPPLGQAVAAADGYGFPSGHAAAAAAVCAVVAWLCTLRLASWRARTAVWAMAAMLAVLVGISRVYLGVHWTTDVLGGWIFGILWAAVVMTGWSASGRPAGLRR